MTRPMTTPGRNPLAMIPPRITRTTTYSTLGSVRRSSQTHSTMNVSPRNTSTPPMIARGISSISAAPNRRAASGTSDSDEPGGPRVDVHAFRERGQAERVIPRDTADRAGDDVEEAGVAELPVRVEVPVQHELGPADVEQDPEHGDEHDGDDAGGLSQHRPPVGAGEGAGGPRLEQPAGPVRSEHPEPRPRIVERGAGHEHADREQREPGREHDGDDQRPLHQPDGEEQDHTEHERGEPVLQRLRVDQGSDRAQVHLLARGDVDAASEEEPSGAGEEAADDGVRHEPDQVAALERAERQERDTRQGRHDHGHRDDGEERPVGAPERVQRGGRGDDREHGHRRALQAAHHAADARPPREDRERDRGRHRYKPMPSGKNCAR